MRRVVLMLSLISILISLIAGGLIFNLSQFDFFSRMHEPTDWDAVRPESRSLRLGSDTRR